LWLFPLRIRRAFRWVQSSEPEKPCAKNVRVIPPRHSARFPSGCELYDRSRMLRHEHHEATGNEIESRLAGRAKMIVAAPALVEAYAVLTRLPPPHRWSPQTALTLLENNFFKLATVIALNAKLYETLLLVAPKNNVAGGRTYDAVIGACAEQGKASTVLTFNAGDFLALRQNYAVLVPGTI